jgi:hypothetical protein
MSVDIKNEPRVTGRYAGLRGQAWLSSIEPQAVGDQCRLGDIEFALDLDVKRFQTAQRKIGPPVGCLVHEAQVWKSPRQRCDR